MAHAGTKYHIGFELTASFQYDESNNPDTIDNVITKNLWLLFNRKCFAGIEKFYQHVQKK